MPTVFELLKLADFPAPQQQQAMPPPAPAPSPKPDPKPMPVQGSAFKAPTITPAAGGSGSFTVQHPGPGGTAIDTGQVSEQQQQLAEQSQQLQEQEQKMVEQQNHMNEQRMADMQTTMAMTVDQQKNTQDQLKKHTDQWLKSMSGRLSGGSKVASIFDGPLRADTPSGRLPSPEYAQPDWVPEGAMGSLIGAGRKALFGNLWNQYAPKPLGAVSDINSRFGRNYFDAASTIGRLSEKTPTGFALLANLAGGLASKYMGGGDYSSVGTDATKFINGAGTLLKS
jgi:hypothetical protein